MDDLTLRELCEQAHATSRSKGWYDDGDRNVGELLMLVVSELSEALEELRNGHDPRDVRVENGKPEGFPVEIADAFVRLGDLCGYMDIDITSAVLRKMAYNQSRPRKHGKRF